MATTLQRQLAQLATPSSAVLVPERRASSILFTSQESAGFSRETFYNIGLDGLFELISANSGLFRKFGDSILFDDASKNLERAVEDKSTNDKIDAAVDEFLISVSPFLMLKASLKCLEWLVNRFHIEKYNVESILKCIMPFYDTKAFVLVIQILEIENFKSLNKEWYWLAPCGKSGTPLSKITLYSNVNAQFIGWLFGTMQDFLKIHSQQESLRTYISFMSATIVGVLNGIRENQSTKKSDRNAPAVIRRIWRHLADLLGIKNEKEGSVLQQNEEIHCMIYLIMVTLLIVEKEKPGLIKQFGGGVGGDVIKCILKTHPRTLKTQAYLLLNALAENSNSNLNLQTDARLRRVLNELSVLSSDWDLWDILWTVIFDPKSLEQFFSSPNKMWKQLAQIDFTVPQRSQILKTVYNTLCSTPGTPKKKWANKFLTRFEREYPTEFALASQGNDQFAKDLARNCKGKDVLLLSQHFDAEMRVEAVKKLIKRFKNRYIKTSPVTALGKKAMKENVKTLAKKHKQLNQKGQQIQKKCKPDNNPIAQALHPRFTDDSVNVVKILVKQNAQILLKMFSLETIVDLLILVIQRNLTKNCTRIALQKLLKIGKDIPESSTALKSKVFMILTPFLFPSGETSIKLAKIILSAPYSKQDSFLQEYSKAFDLESNEVQAQDLYNFSYSVFSSNSMPYPLWNENVTNASQATFACLALNSSANFEDVMAATEKFECASFGGYPINKENFAKCLQIAKKKNALSLELVLGALHKMELTDFQCSTRVLLFTLRSSLNLKNRNVCVNFLQDFLNVTLSSTQIQLDFWCYVIKYCDPSKENPGESAECFEYYLIRTLQFLTAFLSSNPKLQLKTALSPSKRTNSSNTRSGKTQSEYMIELILTRSLLHDSNRVRQGGLNCLQALIKSETLKAETTLFLKNVLTYSEEIFADKNQISVVITEAFRERRFKTVLDRFVEIILSTEDHTLSIGLLKLYKSADAHIFARFIPRVMELLENEPQSQVLLAILDCYDGSVEGTFEVITACLKNKLTCPKILSKFTASVVQKYSLQNKRKLFANLIDSVLHCETPDIKVAVQRCVRKWVLEGSVVAAELEKCVVMEKLQGSSGQSSNVGSRRKGKSNLNSSKSCFGNVQWTDRAEVILEFLQSEKKLDQKTKLILPMFKLLKICIALEEQSPVEYLKQLILTSMTLCCYQDEKVDTKDSNDWIHFNVETIIDCLRCSRNPQTHHHALILLNYAARRYPEQVLHGIMSLFTFMGSSILRQDDAYSTQLIQQTVTTIIPTLANTVHHPKRMEFSKAQISAGIFRVFTSAVQDIPVHRRLPVFTSLVETLEPSESLWQVCIIIVDNALTRDRKRSNLNVDIDLATDLVWNSSPEVVLRTLEKIYDYLMSLKIYDDFSHDDFKNRPITQDFLSKAVIDLARKESFRDVEIVILFTLELVSKICGKFSDLGDQKLNYDFLLEKCLSYSKTVSKIREDKIFRLITHRNFEVIGKINVILDPKDFVRVTKSILDRDDLNVKKKMLDMLNHRIAQKAEWFKDLQVLLELVTPLVELGNCTPETEEMVTVVQIAFLSLKLIARQLASTNPEEFISVFQLCLTHCSNKNRLLASSAMLCMSELFCLKSLILSELHTICSEIQSILKTFNVSEELNLSGDKEQIGEENLTLTATTANLLCISTITCVNKLIEQMGSFLKAKFLQKVLVIVLSTGGVFGAGEKAENRKKIFDLKQKSLMKTIATKIPLRNSLPVLVAVFKKLIKVNDTCIAGLVLLMDTLKDTLQHSTEKLDLATLMTTCDAFLDQFLTYREIIAPETNQTLTPENERVENAIINCLVSGIVLKMSEGVFRPFYVRLLDWASDSVPRLITFYRTSAASAERLKSLFVTFAGYGISKACDFLQKDPTLTNAILKYFFQIFLNDREGFITIDRFNALVNPILDLVESEYVLSGTISIKEVNDVLIQLAVATNDLNRWQYLVELISMKSQHPNSQVRLNIISTLETAGNELGKDFLPLLPPAVPFLAELLTDDDRNVENETRKVLLRLEDLVGEPLQPYFTS